jgi:glycosyltransferase 2 family protein
MLKTFFVKTLKLAIAAALITWLVSSGKLDFRLLYRLKEFPLAVFVAVFLVTVNFLLVSWRWRTILESKSQVKFPLLGMLRVTWIGQFFSSVLPGSVSGDLLKMLYIQEYDPKFSKKYVFASILIDRAMGLTGLILLVGMSSLTFSTHILKSAPDMAPLINLNYTLAVIFLSGFAIFFFYHNLLRRLLVRMEQIFFPKLWQQLTALWDDLTAIKSRMFKAILISILTQFFSVVVFWSLISPFVSGKMDFIQALAFIPIGLMTLALPIAPSGLGVGHAIFQELFKFSGIENGASLFNIFFVITVSVNLLGVIPYLLNKKKT